jgi:hypothetical protein
VVLETSGKRSRVKRTPGAAVTLGTAAAVAAGGTTAAAAAAAAAAVAWACVWLLVVVVVLVLLLVIDPALLTVILPTAAPRHTHPILHLPLLPSLQHHLFLFLFLLVFRPEY